MHAIKQKKKLLSIYVKGYYKSIRVLRKIIPLQKQNNILHLQENLVNTYWQHFKNNIPKIRDLFIQVTCIYTNSEKCIKK